MNERSRRCFLSEPLEARLLLAGEPWGNFPNLIKQSNAIGHYPNINGSGQSIAIIDTGVDYKHPALGGGFGPGYNGVQSPFAIEYPAADPNAYAIGSINSSDVISTFTERSADLDLLAPGENIPTAYYDPSTKKHIYVAATGTSFAAPFAAAAA